ncbi:MAG: preprotein translocase subunit SecG [Actinobacteria bacterium]|nr:preprotein translocase subunit SecG [Actinomycetota bacterium]
MFVALQVILGVLVIILVLAHSGKDTGLSGAFGIGQSQFGATQVMERNLTRMTIVVAVLLVANTIFLGFLLQ